MIIIESPTEFEWDLGNSGKNFEKHNVSDEECEEVFFDSQKKIFKDTPHSGDEARYILVAGTKVGRVLFVVFTIRNKKIRVISARDLKRKERKKFYEKE